MNKTLSVLHLEDNAIDAELFRMLLEGEGIQCTVICVRTRRDFQAALERGFDLIVSDFTLPGFDGLAALKMARQHCPDTPFIFASGTMREAEAQQALALGASDFVVKDDAPALVAAVKRVAGV
jgi:CheY-like chemotaxis protein